MPHHHDDASDEDEQAASSDRLVFFTDAVVAIAITLLALPLVDLAADPGARAAGAGALLVDDAGAVVAFLLSFLIISRLWWGHHELMRHAVRTSRGLARVNSLWVLAVVLLPFTTQVTVTFVGTAAPAALYGGDLVLCSASLVGLGALLVRRPGLLAAGSGAAVRRSVLGSATACCLLLLAAVLAVLVPELDGWSYLLLFASGPVGGLLRRTRAGRWARGGGTVAG